MDPKLSAEQALPPTDDVINRLPGIYYVFDQDGHLLRWNDNFLQATGYSHDEAAQAQVQDFFASVQDQPLIAAKIHQAFIDGHMLTEVALRDRHGERTPYLLNAVRVQIDGKTCLSGIGITGFRRYKEALGSQAGFDELTQLASRDLLNDRIQQAIAYADRSQTMSIVVVIDLDNFKLFNDTHGHEIGDQLLVQLARRLTSCVRNGDTVARHGGDAFVLVLYDQHDDEAIAAWIGRLAERIAQAFVVSGHELFIACSIGISMYPRDGNDVPTLLQHAGLAMNQAKAAGGKQFQFFIPRMNQRIRERLTLQDKLRRAIEREEFLLYYQPQVDLASDEVVGAEALIRWMDPEHGLQPPAKFMAAAEESGLIVPIGQWVLEQACMHNKQLQDAGFDGLSVSVNLSSHQFSPNALAPSIQSALKRSGMAPGSLKLEVSERIVMERPDEAEDMLQQLKRIGVHLTIDDFGCGYSSLNYLQRFPVDQLKIDQSFVQRLADDANDAAITQAIIALAHSLNLKVAAEGVCSKQQLAFLRQHACDEIQGNYFCQAVPFDQLQQLLSRRQEALQ